MIRWGDIIESWAQLYDKFRVNREYRTKSWSNDEDYRKEQNALVKKIEELDAKVIPEIKKIINEAYPEVEFVAFDSRFHNADEKRVGNVLIKGADSETKLLEIAAWFERNTAYTIAVFRIEDLPEDVRKKKKKRARV